MSDKFPHLVNNESTFPNSDGVNVFQYDNKFDYKRFDYSQMHVLICNVPWDMGEAHIGARTISGIGNVVHFGTAAKRDAWFDAIPDSKCYRFDTKYKNLHRDEFIDVPIPFDVMSKYNYVAVSYEIFAHESDPVMYEDENGLRKWFWFIREVEFLAPNTTRLHIMNDAFQTFIYEIDITGMILERGHAPMIANKVSTYLSNPIGNCKDLLAPDVDYGNDHDIAVKSYEKVFNVSNMGVLVVCTSNPQSGNWGTKGAGTWNTPARNHSLEQGNENYLSFFIKGANNVTAFLNNVDSNCPQFMQTVQCVAFVSEDLLTLGSSFTFCSTTCYRVEAAYKQTNFATLAKADFGFDSKYANITKLYTYPYSYLEVTDEMGNVTEVRIESTNGKLTIEHSVSLVYPWLNINAHLSNVGKASRKSVSFANATSRNIPIGGKWYEYLYKWQIPTFAVTQDAALYNDYSTHFDRAQQQTAATNTLASSNASATTNQTNANNTATANMNNATADANLTTTTATLQNSLSTALNTASNTKAHDSAFAAMMLNGQQADASYAFTNATTNNQIDYQYATGTLAAFQSGLNGAVSGGTTMAAGGPYAAAAGAICLGGIGAISALLGAQAGVNLTSAQATATQTQMLANLGASDTATGRERDAVIDNNNSNLAANTAFTTANAAATAATITTKGTNTYNAAVSNAANTYNTDTANATRTYNTETAAIANQVNQAALNAPEIFGDLANGEDAANKPIGLFANIITQNDYAISRAGDDMLRYGYMYGKQWDFDGNWTPGDKFTYWKLEDFWVRNLNVGDMYMDKLRFFLYGGVTIWKKPEDIGNVTIYQNGF